MDSFPYETITPEEAASLRSKDVLEEDDAYRFIKNAPRETRKPRFARNGLRGASGDLTDDEKGRIADIGTPKGWVLPDDGPRI